MKKIYKYLAEWISDKKLCTKLFDTEQEANEFASDAYLDCLVIVSVKKVRYIP